MTAVGVYETEVSPVRRAGPRCGLDDRSAVGRQPVLPLLRELRAVLDSVECSLADRAATILGSEEPEGGVVDRQGRSASSPGPVFGQGRVVERRSARNDLVSDDGRPGELVEVGAALAVAEHPPVLSGFIEPVEVPGDDPVPRFVRMAESCPLVGELPQVAVQRVERIAGSLRPVVGRPAPDDGVEAVSYTHLTLPT